MYGFDENPGYNGTFNNHQNTIMPVQRQSARETGNYVPKSAYMHLQQKNQELQYVIKARLCSSTNIYYRMKLIVAENEARNWKYVISACLV